MPLHVSVDVSNHLATDGTSFLDTVGTIGTEAIVSTSVNYVSTVQAADSIIFDLAFSSSFSR